MRIILSVLLLTTLFAAQERPTDNDARKNMAPRSERPQLRITQGPKVEFVGVDTAVIAWSTNLPTSTVVHYGTDPERLELRASRPWGSLTHRVTLRKLEPHATYYFRVESGQAQGSGASVTSARQQFRTRDAAAATRK